MFKYERTTLFGVTVGADFPIRLAQHGLIVRAVWIVAVRTLHQAFGNAMMCRQCELCLNCGVALIAQLRLIKPQQALSQPAILFIDPGCTEKLRLRQGRFDFVPDSQCLRKVRGVTRLTGDRVQLVFGPVK